MDEQQIYESEKAAREQAAATAERVRARWAQRRKAVTDLVAALAAHGIPAREDAHCLAVRIDGAEACAMLAEILTRRV